MRGSFVTAVGLVLAAHREMSTYLTESFGAEETQVKAKVHVSVGQTRTALQAVTDNQNSARHFWELSEDTLLDLIALSAQCLAETRPFHDHPCSKDLPGNVMFHNPIVEKFVINRDSLERLVSRFAVRFDVRTQKARNRTTPDDDDDETKGLGSMLRGKQHPLDAKLMMMAKPAGDIEEVFRQFTPRLKAIAVHQQLQSKAAKTAEAERPPSEQGNTLSEFDVASGIAEA